MAIEYHSNRLSQTLSSRTADCVPSPAPLPPLLPLPPSPPSPSPAMASNVPTAGKLGFRSSLRSEEHTSELQSRLHLVCRLLLEKKKRDDAPRDSEALLRLQLLRCVRARYHRRLE